MRQGLRPSVGRFWRDRSGNVALLFGLSIIPLLIGVGIAIDYGRALVVRERMAAAADAAALAIGSWPGLTQGELKTKAQQFFDANYDTSTIGAASKLTVAFSGDDISVNVTGAVPTTFMKLANINSVDVGVTTLVTKKERNIELALVLDTTGSMEQGGKITAMKKAANKMVDTLFDGKSSSDTLKIAVVPFAAAVNVGSDKASASWIDSKGKSDVAKEDFEDNANVKTLDLFAKLKSKKSSWAWAGCVRERAGSGYELTDATPSASTPASLFAPYFAPDEPDDDHADGDRYDNSYIEDGNCGVSTGGGSKGGRRGGQSSQPDPDKCQRYAGKYDSLKTDDSRADGPNMNCPPNTLTPLTSSKGTIASAINALTPFGNTVIPAGLLWGWRVLSPTEPYTQGTNYGDEKWIKAIVLLTDGENMVGGGQRNHNGSAYNAFGYASEGHLGARDGDDAEEELDDKMKTVCSAIKDKGILVYTIGFQVGSGVSGLLKNCASKPDMYYNSPSNDQLASIFQDIAQGLGELRIAQ
jgi:Flp pilus assembly protein TadG